MRCALTILAALALLAALCAGPAAAAFCSGKPSGGMRNTIPVHTAPPKFLKSVANGTLYLAGEGEDSIWLAHVYGDHYSMGYAYGALLRDEIREFFPAVFRHFEEQVLSSLKQLPAWLADIVAREGLDVALDAIYMTTKTYTPPYVEQEQLGMAAATGIDYKMIRRVHLVGEITRGRCSMFGAWGNATSDGRLLQLRALDWDTEGPLQNYPAVIVYHPDPGFGHAFANIGWAGWMGSLTGVSSTQLGISEIGVSFPDDTWGDETVFGIPFVFLLRSILQFEYTLDDAISLMSDSQRTCRLILGVGDGKLGEFRGFQYSHSELNVFDPLNQRPDADWHPHIPDTVYWGMDWLCPSFTSQLASGLQQFHGQITPQNTISDILGYLRSGDLHIGVYDLTNRMMWVANARGDNETGAHYAYDRQYVQFDLDALFAEPRPRAAAAADATAGAVLVNQLQWRE